jgi:murein endopeptidase/LysM repeat protein
MRATAKSLVRINIFCSSFYLAAPTLLASPPALEGSEAVLFYSIYGAEGASGQLPPLRMPNRFERDGFVWPPLNPFQKWSRRIERFSLSLSYHSIDVEPPSSKLEKQPALPPNVDPEAPPDIDALRELIADRPYDLGSLSIGAPDAGALFNAFTLGDGPLWHVRDPRDAWATEETLSFIIAAIRAVESMHPGSPSLCIGDLSRRQGGPIDRHRSHQSGRDADIGWYFQEGAEPDLCQGDVRRLDLPRCWALVRALVTETDVERIFIDRRIQRALFQQALGAGEDRDWLLSLFAIPGGRRDALIQHARGHKSHLHVRFYNRRAQEWGRLAYPFLIEAGLAPPPVVIHRARRGDTLSTIARRYGTSVAAIRRANRLRSSFIRAGRRYRIPTRLTAAIDQEPAVVPPRRLPPAPVIIADNPDDQILGDQNSPSDIEAEDRTRADLPKQTQVEGTDEPSPERHPTEDASMTK